MRRRALLLGLWLVVAAVAVQAEPRERLILAGPPAAVSFPLIHMVESGALDDLADRVEFVLWSNPDQLRVMALDGSAQILAMPSNVAANLYNRGAEVGLLNISTWGILWLVSRDPDVTTLADLRGEEIAMPFRGDMPDIVFATVAQRQNLDPRRDFALRYVASPIDAMQLLIARRVDHALLAEPAVSMALRRTQSFPTSLVAPELFRGISLQDEWGRVFERPPRMPQAGIAAVGAVREDRSLLARIAAAYREALLACQAAPQVCGETVAGVIDRLDAEAVADALAASPLEAITAPQAREELEFFYRVLYEGNPALIGGRLPDDGFYLSVDP